MDKYGFYDYGSKCQVCGAVLGGTKYEDASYDRPAELYAGTYTGLCYKCQNSDAYVVKTEWDGAQTISYPPHCPSWRRDRETYTAYADCQECQGQGRHYISRSFAEGGSYYRYCPTCLDRYCNEAHRKLWQEMYEGVNPAIYQNAFIADLCKMHGVKSWKRVPLFPWTQEQIAEYERLRLNHMQNYQDAIATVAQEIACQQAKL